MSTTGDVNELERLEAEAATAVAKAESARAKAKATALEQRRAREARLAEYDERRWDGYDQAAWEQRRADALAALLEAVAAEPWAQAYIEFLKVNMLFWEEASHAIAHGRRAFVPTAASPFAEQLQLGLEQIAAAAAADELDRLAAEREAYGEAQGA